MRGLHRVLARETNISDLLQYLTDEDPHPWLDLGRFRSNHDQSRVQARPRGQSPWCQGHSRPRAQGPCGRRAPYRAETCARVLPGPAQEVRSVNQRPVAARGTRGDATLVRTAKRWEYLSLATNVHAWRNSISGDASSLAVTANAVIESWDEDVSAVFEPPGSSRRRALDSVRHKFIARVVTRQIVDQLTQHDWESAATVTSGGGLAIVQAWARIRGAKHRCLIAEVRWWEGMRGGELRLGVDYWLPETKESRAEAWELATQMDASIRIDALLAHLKVDNPGLAQLLVRLDSGRKDATCDWKEVVERGFKSTSSPNGVAGNRRNNYPGFAGDGTQRFEAVSPVNFTEASAVDLVDLLEASLIYLRDRIPAADDVRK